MIQINWTNVMKINYESATTGKMSKSTYMSNGNYPCMLIADAVYIL